MLVASALEKLEVAPSPFVAWIANCTVMGLRPLTRIMFLLMRKVHFMECHEGHGRVSDGIEPSLPKSTVRSSQVVTPQKCLN